MNASKDVVLSHLLVSSFLRTSNINMSGMKRTMSLRSSSESQRRNSNLDQEEPAPLRIKLEEEELENPHFKDVEGDPENRQVKEEVEEPGSPRIKEEESTFTCENRVPETNTFLQMSTVIKKGKGVNLIYRDFCHKKDRLRRTKQYWRCVRKGCPGRIHTDSSFQDGDHLQVLHFGEHNHMPNQEKVLAIHVKAQVCALASKDQLTPLSSLYKEFVNSDGAPENEDNAIVPDFHGCRSQMHRARRAKMPPEPTTVGEINLDGQWSTTRSGDRFLLHRDEDSIILATDDNLRLLEQSRVLFMDVTFKAAPRMFAQLLTIHGLYRGSFVPLAFCLLPDRHRKTFYKILETIRREMGERGLILNPREITTDFETDLLATLPLFFPDAKIHGCYSQHTQCIWHRVQLLGLTSDYQGDPRVRELVRKLMALAFIPIPLVRSTFNNLATQPVVDENLAVKELVEYFQSTWISGSFPLPLWNVHTETIRTNSHIKGWHSKLNKASRKRQIGIHDLVGVVQGEQEETELTTRRTSVGASPPRHRRCSRNVDQRLEKLRTQYWDGDISTDEFLDRVQHLVAHY